MVGQVPQQSSIFLDGRRDLAPDEGAGGRVSARGVGQRE
jgi:hypothetical protein